MNTNQRNAIARMDSESVAIRNWSRPAKLNRDFARFDQARWISDAFACYVVGGSVGDTGADEWKPGRDVDRPPAAAHLHGDVALIVIESDDGVELPTRGSRPERIGRQRAD